MSAAGIVLAIIAIILSGCSDPSLEAQLQQEQQLYCEMVQMYKDTGGENGWPDYKRNFGRVC